MIINTEYKACVTSIECGSTENVRRDLGTLYF